MSRRPAIVVNDVSKSFPRGGERLHVLDRIHLTAQPGEFVAVVGPSGCGKSTLFEIVCGLQKADAGNVAIDGQPVSEALGAVGYMPQDDLLFPWRTVVDNVILPLELQRMPRRKARHQAQSLFPLFGLDGFETAYPAQLSGGMRQRAALMRTLINEPSIAALDEPFGALDAQSRHRLQRWLLDVWATFGTTIMLITHDVDEALVLADRVLVLSARPARVVEDMVVDVPRPRTGTEPKFVTMKSHIYRLLGLDLNEIGANSP